jgi:esterase/lipase superfamily enzyme
MEVEYYKWWSPALDQDMELKTYGQAGKPILVFPAFGGRFYEYEDFQMIAAIQGSIDAGRVKVFTVDSLDSQSWGNYAVHPADRGRRHADYIRYITQEVVPFICQQVPDPSLKILTTGVSMGGFHAANFFFRFPDTFDALIALSGVFHLRLFVGDYMDDEVYFNSPLAYLPSLEDEWYLERYRKSSITVCCGQGAWEDLMLAEARELQAVLEAKGVPAWIDLWGQDVNHDWPWWCRMMPYHLGKMGL